MATLGPARIVAYVTRLSGKTASGDELVMDSYTDERLIDMAPNPAAMRIAEDFVYEEALRRQGVVGDITRLDMGRQIVPLGGSSGSATFGEAKPRPEPPPLADLLRAMRGD